VISASETAPAARKALPAKLTRPAAGGLVRRERLFRLLDESLRRKLVWVSGPGGAGKTSLVSTYLETRRMRSLWYQVDSRDADVATFFHYLRQAGQGRGAREPLPAFAPEHDGAGLDAFARPFFETFFARFPEQLTLVFDAYQEVPADARLHEAMNALLAELPAHARVIVVSRAKPPAALARWVASAEFAAIERHELAFSLEESAVLAQSAGVHGEADIARIRELSRGWAAGLTLLLRAAQRGVPFETSADSAPESLFDYFAAEIFARIAPAQRAFLLQTACIPSLTPKLAERLTGDGRSARILAELSRDNFFTERRSQTTPVYEYHPLFRKFLVDRASEAMTSAEIAALRVKAAELLEQEEQIDVAALLLIEARDWEGLKAFVRRYADDMMGRGRFRTLRGWIDAIPPALAKDAPWVLLWKGICQAGAHEPAFLDTVREACALFDARDDYVGACTARIWRIRLNDPLAELHACLAELEQLTARHRATPEEEAEILGTFGRFRFDPRLSGTHPVLSRWLDRAAELARLHTDPAQRLRMVNFVASAVSLAGDYARLREIVAEHARLPEQRGVGASERLNFMIVTALLRASEGRWGEVADIIARVRELVETSGFPAHEATLATAAMRCHIGLGDMAAARAAKERLALLAGSSAMARIHYLVAATHVAVADHDLPAARAAVRELLQLVPPDGSFRPRVETLHGLVLLEDASLGEAVEQLANAARLAVDSRQPVTLYPALLLATLAHARGGRQDLALESLRQALALGARHGMRVGSVVLPRALMAEVCTLALRHGVEVGTASDLISALSLEPPAEAPESWPWAARVSVLGRFGIELAGKEATEFKGRKQPKKPHELLKFIVAQGGARVAVGAAIDALWQESEGDAGKKAFEITLHRLRKLLGSEQAVCLEGGQLFLDRRVCWVDAFAFEALTERATQSPRDHEAPARALALFRGPFLGEEDFAWAPPYRERLRSRYVDLVLRWGARLEAGRRSGEAEQCYRAALELERTAEPVYRALMKLLADRGEAAQAIEVYRRCRDMLSIVLSVRPSTETELVYQTLTAR
jgi:ATP/maltotriose-dependent transcriptional regulator MalT/DNA-binding SARP family transcriptional activator